MELKGKVFSGKGDFKDIPDGWKKYYNSKTKTCLEKGSLNIRIKKPIMFNKLISKEYKHTDSPDGRYVYLIPCLVKKGKYTVRGFIQRIQNVEEDDNNYPPKDIIEILSNINFRNSWCLKDGEEIIIEIKSGPNS